MEKALSNKMLLVLGSESRVVSGQDPRPDLPRCVELDRLGQILWGLVVDVVIEDVDINF